MTYHEHIEPAPIGHVGPRPGSSIGQSFAKFHAENPHVYEELAKLAKRWRRRGIERCGIGMLFEVLRWRHGLASGDGDFKLNNNYRALYARMLMRRELELRGMFEIRQLHRNRGEDA